MTTPAPGAFKVDAANAAILSLDLQAGIVSVYVKDDSFVPRAARTLRAARTAGLSVVHVKVGFRPRVPEANPRNMFLSAIRRRCRTSSSFRAPAAPSISTSESKNAI